MYAGVPSSAPVAVSWTSSDRVARRTARRSRAIVDLAAREAEIGDEHAAVPRRSTLCGLKSRWTRPAACAAASPRPAASNASTDLARRWLGRAATRRGLAVDELHRDEVAAAVACRPRRRSSTFGCLSRAIARASRSSRVRSSGLASPPRSSLIATSRSRSGSRAAHTTPMPPAPSSAQDLVLADPRSWRRRARRFRIARCERVVVVHPRGV